MRMSAQFLIERLVALFPDFARYWDDPENCFRNDDGSFTYCGAFSEFSHFFRDHYEQLPKHSVMQLGQLLSECMSEADSELGIAAATCFLENVAMERFGADFAKSLNGKPLAFYTQWNDHS